MPRYPNSPRDTRNRGNFAPESNYSLSMLLKRRKKEARSERQSSRKARRSTMTIGQAITSAYHAGKQLGDTGLFEQWLAKQGLEDRSDNIKSRLQDAFDKGVEEEITPSVTQKSSKPVSTYKGIEIYKTDGGGFITSLDRDSEFDDMKQVKRFIDHQQGVEGNPSDIKFVMGINRSIASRGVRGGQSEVQSVLFDRSKWNISNAKRWLKEHGFGSNKVDETGAYLRFRQIAPSQFKEFRTVEANPFSYITELKKALKGLSPTQLEEVVKKKDSSYDYARAEGFNDREATEFAYIQAIKLAKDMKKRKQGNPSSDDSTSLSSILISYGFSLQDEYPQGKLFIHSNGLEGFVLKDGIGWNVKRPLTGGIDGEGGKGLIKAIKILTKKIFSQVEERPFTTKDLGLPAKPDSKGRYRKNPSLDDSQSLFESFHGRPSTHLTEIAETEHYPSNLAALGELEELEILIGNNKVLPITFSREHTPEIVMVCATPDAKQIEFVGGDQSLPLDDIELTNAEKGNPTNKSLVEVGPIYGITYWTDKHHLSGPKYQKTGCSHSSPHTRPASSCHIYRCGQAWL